MADKKFDKLLSQAQKAFDKQDKRKGNQLVGKVLKKDFTNREAWELLHQVYGASQLFEDFQRAFTQKHFPDKIDLIISSQLPFAAQFPSQAEPPAPEKQSFFARLLSRLKRKKDKSGPAQEPSTGLLPQADSSASTSNKRSSLLQSASTYQEPKTHPRGASILPQSASTYQPRPPSVTSAADQQKIRVIVVDDITQTRENIVRTLRFQDTIEVVGTGKNGKQAIQLVKDLRPDVVVMDVNMPDMDGIAATTIIRNEVPHSQVVILTVQEDTDYIRKAMLAGARDYLTKPPMIDDLLAAVVRANEYARQEKARAVPVAAVQAPVAPTSKGRIITVYSPRGGVGCTTIASNLAVSLHNDETPVILVDGNLQYGDIPVFFNVRSKNTVLDLAHRAAELDAELVEEVAIQHSSGVRLIGPPSLDEADRVTGQQFAEMLRFLSQLYPYVIVDTAHRLTDVTLAAFDASHLVVVLTTQDVPCIAKLRKFLDLAPALNLGKERIMLVMNQFDKRVGITPDKVSQAFKYDVGAVLPLERETVIPSANRGVPFILQKELIGRPISKSVLFLTQAVRQRLSFQ